MQIYFTFVQLPVCKEYPVLLILQMQCIYNYICTLSENKSKHFLPNVTRKPCCCKETTRCRSCSFRFKVHRQHSTQV